MPTDEILTLEIEPPYIGSAVSPTVDIAETTDDITVTITDFRGEHSYTVEKTDQAIEDAEQAAQNANDTAQNVAQGWANRQNEINVTTNSMRTLMTNSANAESQRVIAENARVSAENERVQEWDELSADAEAATSAANAATVNATSAASAANSAASRAQTAAEAAEGIVMDDIPLMSANIRGGAKLGAGLAIVNGALELDGDGDIATAVDAWLDAHPEATTTVQDGSVTNAKLAQTGGVLSEVIDIRTGADDTAYASAGDAVRSQSRIPFDFILNQRFSITVNNGGINTDIIIPKNFEAIVNIDSISNLQGVQFFVEGDSQNAKVVSTTGTYKLTPNKTGLLRFYGTSGTIGGTVYIKSRFDDIIDELSNDIVNQIKPYPSIQIKTKNVFDSAVHMNKYITDFSGAPYGTVNIFNYEDYLNNSSVGRMTEPIRIRNWDGTLRYPDIRIIESPQSTNAVLFMYTADINGNFIRVVHKDTYDSRDTVFLDDEYYASFVEYPTVYPIQKWIVGGYENIEWLNPNDDVVYHVGIGKDWETFTEMLIALENDTSEKTVYVDGGVYDIFEEMGGAEMIASISDPSQLNWRDVCHVVPPNTHIIGVGHVVLKWTPDAQDIGSQAMAFLFSPLNVSGNCEIENIEVRAKNARYAIHDETSGQQQYDGAKHVFKRVKAIFEPSTYSTTYAYGAGHNKNMEFYFEDCYFESAVDRCFSTHDWPAGINEASSFTFKNCVFKVGNNDSLVQFISSDTVGRLDQVSFDGCQLLGIRYANTQNYQALQGYEVTAMCCNNFTESAMDIVTFTVPAKRYLTIPSI